MFPIEFILFGAILIGVALLHRHALPIAVAGAATIALYKMVFAGFETGPGLRGFVNHLGHEWVVLVNLLFLLLGFALLARHFEDTRIPALLPRWLPDNWTGGFVLLVLVFVLSSFLDNIAAAMIGGAVAHTVFRGKVHLAYLVGIVAAANAGGAGSVIGDTTTTMMWIAGIPAVEVFHAYIAAGIALAAVGLPASMIQQRHAPIQKDPPAGLTIDGTRTGVVAAILLTAMTVNVLINTHFQSVAGKFPFLGIAVAGGLILTAPLRRPQWSLLGPALSGALFLLSLVLCASMMPVERLPSPSWHTAFGLGFLSSVFDNIPLTALALEQGGYDWGFLAFAVGFGGSMVWFGSSAGVALTSQYPEARSVFHWLRQGWFAVAAYILGFLVLLATRGYHPG